MDADALLSRGQMPLNDVMAHARQLEGKDLLCLTVSFKPTPMIEALGEQGFRTFLRSGSGEKFELLIAAAV
ncbi:MAG: hypothetical protein CME25_17225 [Gemmatimonadetes bacterium]|nr:hypothetical protein [Gemmatimonadota bacterium]